MIIIFLCYYRNMKLIRTLHVTSDEFYSHLEKEFIRDAKKNANKKISVIEKGLHYSMHGDDRYARIDFKVLEYQRGSLYSLQMKSYTDTITVVYRTKEVEDGLEVEFEQEIESEKHKKRNALSRKFSETVYLSRMSRTIYDIETAIIKERNK